jgi:hypothetical protein
MRINFSPSMNKALSRIEEMIKKDFLIYINGEQKYPSLTSVKIKPTKKKEFLALPFFLDKPAFKLYINNRYYGIYSFDVKKDCWIEDLS